LYYDHEANLYEARTCGADVGECGVFLVVRIQRTPIPEGRGDSLYFAVADRGGATIVIPRPVSASIAERNRRCCIGVFIEWISDGYSDPVLEELVAVAQERGVGIRCFVGGCSELDFPIAKRHVPLVYASPKTIDAAIVVSLGNALSTRDLEKYFERFEHIPVCGMAMHWDRYPSVEVDNESGVRAGVQHLIRKHGRSKIACIRGPLTSNEAEKRLGAYREVLTEFGVEHDDRYVVEGHYMRQHGAEGVRALLDERGLEVDAIVAANDAMAIGVIEELESRGIAVPEAISVLGFDDIDEARYYHPPLSTVRQPVREHARTAFDVVIDQLEGRPTAKRIIVDSKLVLRKSCGCVSSRGLMPSSAPPPAEALPGAQTSENWIRETCAALVEFLDPEARIDGLHRQLADTLLLAIFAGAKSPFLQTLDRQLERLAHGGDLSIALPLFEARRHALRTVAASSVELEQLDDLMSAAMAMAGESAERFQAQRRHDAKESINCLLRLNVTLMQTGGLEELGQVLAEQLPRLGVNGCYLCVWEGREVPARWSRLLVACDSGKARRLPEGGVRFPAEDILPNEIDFNLSSSAWLVSGTVFECYVVLRLGRAEAFVFNSLVDQIGSNFKRLDLMKQLKEANRQLETIAHTDALTQLSNRRHLVSVFEIEFNRARRHHLQLSCAILDIDHFKRINDEHGHLVGDKVLKAVARLLADSVRQTDLVGRYGGEEFCLILAHTALEETALLADKLRLAIAQLELSEGGSRVEITASFGVAQVMPEDQAIADVIGRADSALYRAKRNGRNRVECTPLEQG
jgi:diguanylate cyclase (GGDEF)-like protein